MDSSEDLSRVCLPGSAVMGRLTTGFLLSPEAMDESQNTLSYPDANYDNIQASMP